MLERKSIQLPLQKKSVMPLNKNIRKKKKWNNTKQNVLLVTKALSGSWGSFSRTLSLKPRRPTSRTSSEELSFRRTPKQEAGVRGKEDSSLYATIFFSLCLHNNTLEVRRSYCSYFTDKETKVKASEEVRWTAQGHIPCKWSQKSNRGLSSAEELSPASFSLIAVGFLSNTWFFVPFILFPSSFLVLRYS